MSDDQDSTVGNRVRAARLRLGLSQGKLAALVPGLHQQSVDQLEKGKIARPRFLAEIAQALGVPEPWLRTGTGGSTRPAPERDGDDLDLMHDVVVVLERTLAQNGLDLDQRTRRLLARAFYELMLQKEELTRAATKPGPAASDDAGSNVTGADQTFKRRYGQS